MKFSYQWLSELVPGLAAEPADLQRLITIKTAECEDIEPVGAHFTSLIAARILTAEPLPKGKNKAVTADVGSGKHITVVCGAENARPGIVVPWVPPGTVLEGKTIRIAAIEGVESNGMLASAAELGISRDHSGLLELQDVEPGQPLPGLRPDWIIEIDNKSLTHRPDLWGHVGMAREVAAITGGRLQDPVKPEFLAQGSPQIRVEIADLALCPRYSALVLDHVAVAPSPLWLQARLESLGLNPISNIVDITNYVLAELPQPMHAFDADKLAGDIIFVRTARSGEQLKALNGEAYTLSPADLVIADADGPIALAGVIGGADTAISETTTRVVLESANFQASSVRLTSARHKLRTDASMRFEKSLDPENTIRGLARATELLAEIAPSVRPRGGVTDARAPLTHPAPILLAVDTVERKLGARVGEPEITRILEALGFGVVETVPGLLTVTVPSWRATKDISHKDDLVEEIGRMVGYDSIHPIPPLVASVVPPANPLRLYLRKIRTQIAAQGFTEIYNYSFVNDADVARFLSDIRDHIAVENPIASELTHLRRSLLPGLFKNIVSNVRHFDEFRIFEIGIEIHPDPNTGLPQEIPHLAAAIYNAHGEEADFFELKRVAECLFPGMRLSAVEAAGYEHPARTAEVQWGHSNLGRLFELHPSVLQAEGIEGRAVILDVDLSAAQAISDARVVKYVPPRKYPTSGFDLSVLAEARTPVDMIEDALRTLTGSDLALLEFVRVYTGPPLPVGQKSVSYHLDVGAPDRTLSNEEAMDIRNRIINGMREMGFDLRV